MNFIPVCLVALCLLEASTLQAAPRNRIKGTPCEALRNLVGPAVDYDLQGQPVDLLGQGLDRNADWRFLGFGIGGGEVYRAFPDDGSSSYIVKEYFEIGGLLNDLYAFDFIWRAFKTRAESQFGVVSAKHVPGSRFLKLSDARGEVVEDRIRLSDPQTRQRIVAEFTAAADRAADALTRAFASELQEDIISYTPKRLVDENDCPRWIFTVRLQENRDGVDEITIAIKADNVILSRNGLMTIIDPN